MADQPQYRRDPEFVALVVHHLTTTEITGVQLAEKLGVSYTTIQRITVDQKLSLNHRRNCWDLDPEEMWRRVRELLDTTALPTGEIADMLHITINKVQQCAYHNNYSLRRRKEQLKAGIIEKQDTTPVPKTASGGVDINKLWKPRR